MLSHQKHPFRDRQQRHINVATPTFPYLREFIEFLSCRIRDPDWTTGERLTMGRKFRGINQEAMARRLGVDPGTLAKWERGKIVPKGSLWVRLNKVILDERRSLG